MFSGRTHERENAAHQIDPSLTEAEHARIAVEWLVEGFMHCTHEWEPLRWWTERWYDEDHTAPLPLMDLETGIAVIQFYQECESCEAPEDYCIFSVPHCRYPTVHRCKRPFTNVPEEEVIEQWIEPESTPPSSGE